MSDWSSDVCSSDLRAPVAASAPRRRCRGTPADGHVPGGRGWESRAGSAPRRRTRWKPSSAPPSPNAPFRSFPPPVVLARRQPASRHVAEGLTYRLVSNLLHRLVEESLDQHAPGRGAVDTARQQIEQRLLVEFAGRGAVAALDVVGVDLELRLDR